MKKLFILMLLISCCSVVNAQSFYTNNNGVEMSEEQYNKLAGLYSNEYIERVVTQEEFDNFMDLDVVGTQNMFEKTTYRNGYLVNRELISEDEYNNADVSNSTRSTGSIGTEYKKLTVYLTHISGTHYGFMSVLEWKKVPKVRSYDVFAFRVNNFSFYDIIGNQFYYTASGFGQYDYDYSSPGYKHLSNGVGFSMNLVDGSNITKYEMCLSAELYVNTTQNQNANLWVSYQHAQSSLSRADSMKYTLNQGGLGDVINFTYTTTSNKYDGMPGILMSQPIN